MASKNTKIEKAYEYLKKSPMFKLSLSSKELFHSNFLEWLSNVDEQAFKSLILDMAGLKENKYEWPKVWRVKREYKNFDLCVVAYDQDQYENDNEDEKIDDDEDFRILFVIENKVKSIPYKEQLERYALESKKKNEAYWKNRGNDLLNKLKQNGFNDDKKAEKYWIGIEDGQWVLKQGKKTGPGKKTQWSEPIPLNVPIFNESEGEKNKTKFLECYTKWKRSPEISIRYILLSLAQSFPEYDGNKNVWRVGEADWKVCNYRYYKSRIKKRFEDVTQGLNSQIIADYCKFIEYLTTLSKVWAKDYVDQKRIFLYADNDNYKKAHKSRIHDLYQKLKFSYLCTLLFKRVKDKYGEKYDKVFPSNQAGLFKEKNTEFEPGMNYICVNYTYLHGEPLLEINVHPKCEGDGIEMYYAIQVQGNAYEHGVQVKKNENTTKKLKRDKEKVFSETVWNRLNDTTISIMSNWMNVKGVSNWEEAKADWMIKPDRVNQEFNKYDMNDGTYVYQKYIINDNASISDVLEQMLSDLEYIDGKLNKDNYGKQTQFFKH